MSKKEEGQIQASGISYLRATGWKVIRFNNVGLYDPTLKMFRKSVNEDGISDVLAIKDNNNVWIEFKKPSEKKLVERIDINKSPQYKSHVRVWNQKRFIEDVIQHGNMGFFAYSLDDVMDKLGGF